MLPGGTPAAAALHLCRTVARRAERLTVELAARETVNPEAVHYINRLSDFFFVAARVAERQRCRATSSGCPARIAEPKSNPLAFIPLYDTNPLRHIRCPWVAWALIAANVFVYFFVEWGGFSGEPTNASAISFGLFPAFLNGVVPRPMDLFAIPDSLTLVTYAFLHGSFWHLAGNMIFLWVFADNVEDALGHFRYFIFYSSVRDRRRLHLRALRLRRRRRR